jgi:hypothetical protein
MATIKSIKRKKKNKEPKKDIAATYNQYKFFEGQQYTGMKIGRSHKWYYDKGIWKDRKITPDIWEIEYEVVKRRAGKAPEGSGVPVGSEYHWYIIAHQHVKKLDANSYSTTMTGLKYKLAHKRADSDKWSASDTAKRKRLIKFLQEVIDGLQKQPAEVKNQNGKKNENGISSKKITISRNKKKTIPKEELAELL